ncbi:Epimerase domain-containing protein [Hirschfeldia incana]|nr:Epimerase domain-containing protein [Hirschfeldia incana]
MHNHSLYLLIYTYLTNITRLINELLFFSSSKREMNGGGKVVCVTGASGYIASWIVKLLLLGGYTVKGTVRNPKDKAKTEHLLALEGAKERLKLFKTDLLEECSFEQAIEGCDAVFHTASPVKFIVTDPQTELIDPAVKGTINVLNTCKKTSSVKRVILTSSTVAVLIRQPPLGPNDVVDETFFSDPSYCMETKFWYPLSKTLAEKAAWQFAKDNGMDMIVIVPGFIIGPLLQPTLNYSVEKVVDIINGKNPFHSINYRFVDVRDVALAHVKALETPSANGRYIMDGPSMTIYDIKEVMRKLFPDLCIADTNGENEMKDIMTKEIIYKVCVEKVKNLGVEFTPVESSLRDTIISLKENCLL